ncbi:TPA: hypothetical protein RQN04_002024 [Aeromonas hydrophila]|nr:hypothetical protein [Aeromonas hydrophila]
MSYTETELTGALAQAEAANDQATAGLIRSKLAALKGTPTSKLPNMDAYLTRCVDRCRPKGSK